jgi:hypothetical protein
MPNADDNVSGDMQQALAGQRGAQVFRDDEAVLGE